MLCSVHVQLCRPLPLCPWLHPLGPKLCPWSHFSFFLPGSICLKLSSSVTPFPACSIPGFQQLSFLSSCLYPLASKLAVFLLIQHSYIPCGSPMYDTEIRAIRLEASPQSFPWWPSLSPACAARFECICESEIKSLQRKIVQLHPCLSLLTVSLPTLASSAVWTGREFPNHQCWFFFCLTVPSTVYVFPPALYRKEQVKTRSHLPHFALKSPQLKIQVQHL